MVGKRYGRLPSELMKLPLVWLCFNADVASRSIEYEIEKINEARGETPKATRATMVSAVDEAVGEMPTGSKAKEFFDSMKR